MVSILDLRMDVNSLLHVVKGELGVIHRILGSMDVVVGILERALDSDVQYTSANCRIRTYAKADWYPALPKLAWSEQAYPHWVLTAGMSTVRSVVTPARL